MLLLELPNAPDWPICQLNDWLTLALPLPLGPSLALSPTELPPVTPVTPVAVSVSVPPPAPPAPPAAVPSSEALCSARLSVLKELVLVVVSAAALCVVTNPIAAAATKIAAAIARLV
jgi:hypothetical protein